MPDTTVIQIPFSGFYESKWSQEIDYIEENETEYFETDRQAEDGVAKELRLDAREYGEILNRRTSYSDAYRQIAKDYADAFNDWFKDECDLDLGLTYESMSSPREYNFTTDRIFAHIPMTAVRALFDRSVGDNHKRLAEIIKRRFTSYDGFISHYRNNLADWLAKDVADWDHNELETLLLAVMPESDRNYEWDILEGMNEKIYSALSNAVDWEKVDADIAELRAEKLAEIQGENPGFVPPYRCPDTPDLFASRE